MGYHFQPMSEAPAWAIVSWAYPEPYSPYDGDPANLGYLLDPANQFYAVTDDHGGLIGFFSFGADAQVPGSLSPAELADKGVLDVGLGLRPDLTGRGLGVAFVEAGLDFARATFAPRQFRLSVLSWNERAIRVYERAGFQRIRSFTSKSPRGTREFILLGRPA